VSGGKRSGTEAVTFRDRVTGREIVQLTNSHERSVHGYYDLPPWSAVDGRIVFTSMARPGAPDGDVYVMDRDGANITYLAHSRRVTPNGGALAQWSPDGRRVYFCDKEGKTSLIAWVDMDTGERGEMPGDLRMISPTANRAVYHTRCADYSDEDVVEGKEEHGVYVLDLETGRAERIVSVADCLRLHPRYQEISDWHLYIKHTKWSPDGRRLQLVLTNASRYEHKYAEQPRVKDIYVVNADGSDLKRVGHFASHPLWHPNGREILSCSLFAGRSGLSLVLHDVATGRMRLATDRIGGHGHPSHSPDGRWISVDHVLAGEGYGSVNLVDLRHDSVVHAAQVSITNHSHTGTHLHPVWSRDSREVLYASDASGVAQLCLVRA